MTVTTAPAPAGFDPSAVATVAGAESDPATCYFVMRWNDGLGVENIALGLAFDPAGSDATPEALFDKIFDGEADWRFYKDPAGAYCFDLNGDKVREGDPAQYDHRALDGAGGEWQLAAPAAQVAPGDVIVAEFIPQGEASHMDETPLFYLPPADTAGAWVVPGRSFALADATYDMPVYINLQGGTYSSISWAYYKDAESTGTDSTIASMSVTAGEFKAGATMGHLTTKKEGTVYIGCRLSYKPVGATSNTVLTYNRSVATVTAAEKPLTGLKLNLQGPLQLNHSYDLAEHLELTPADATYTGGITYKLVSSDPKSIAGISGSKLSTRTTPGTITVSATSKLSAAIAHEITLDVECVNPVTSISFVNIDPARRLAIEFDPYKMEYNNTSAILKVEPADADLSKLALKIIDSSAAADGHKVTFQMGNGMGGFTDLSTDIVTTYQQNDGAYDLMVWGYGTAKVVFEATDGSGVASPELDIDIVERSLNIADDFADGTFWLNEDWFGHTNGSLNYLDAEGNISYRVYNYENFDPEHPRDNRTFGCTSQYGMIFGDRLYVMSKQAHDTGDRYQTGGGRLVIADARTLRRLHSFDVIGADAARGGDGRACVGVSASKVYLGHHAGIRVLNIDNSAATPEQMFTLGKELTFAEASGGGDLTPGNPQGDLYSNQIGDMVYACGHVFAVMQDRGLLVIDTATDTWTTTLGDQFTQAVTQSADGNIWYARNNTATGIVSLHCVDPETLEEIDSCELPRGAGTINTGWGAWRSANFFASRTRNVLYWAGVGSGYQDDILGAGTGDIYRWEIGSELPAGPFFSLGDRPGKDAETFQRPYATMRYDDRHDRILMATTHGASYNYRYNWLYFIDGTTGEIERVQETTRYFWFPAIPIFPDKAAPEINIGQLSVAQSGVEKAIDLTPYINDNDNNIRNINLRVEVLTPPAAAPARVRAAAEEEVPAVAARIEGHTLLVKAARPGNHTLRLTAESNGRETTRDIALAVSGTTGIDDAALEAAVTVRGDVLTVTGMDGTLFSIHDMAGRLCHSFRAAGHSFTTSTGLPAGLYILSGDNGYTQKLKID